MDLDTLCRVRLGRSLEEQIDWILAKNEPPGGDAPDSSEGR